ncbi:hypothetical protein B0H66DRAFT_346836 [Apodospora peruviana]|uniref:DUF8021 domain-containing protein n=1 Tax=Apodospora peruviana TaxID=516989 RepID=A0AAE0M1N7_9PEZI|nr:hypothetical protein B0H66DRAFT_346836 [Apodospora peruviana]
MYPSPSTPAIILFLLIHSSMASTSTSSPCSLSSLQTATSRYLIAQSTGQLNWLLPFLSPTNFTYLENLVPLNISNGSILALFPSGLKVDHSRTAYDVPNCASYTELLVTTPSHPYQIGTQLHLSPSSSGTNLTSSIISINSIITTNGDLFFNATHTLHYTLRENWSPIPPGSRDSRAVLQAAADAYYDVFVNKTVKVPWGKPCTRLEGGYLDADGDCDTDIPDVTILTTNRRYVIDETLGVVDVISNFGILGPDSHEFRIVNGTIRHIHSMTLCSPVANCGLEVPAILTQDIGF